MLLSLKSAPTHRFKHLSPYAFNPAERGKIKKKHLNKKFSGRSDRTIYSAIYTPS